MHNMANLTQDTHVLSPYASVCLHLLSPLILFRGISVELAELSAELLLGLVAGGPLPVLCQ